MHVSPHSWVLSVSTCIFPDLVMKLVENNFLVFNVVVSEDDMSLWARRVHIWRVSEDPGEKGKAKGERKGERSDGTRVLQQEEQPSLGQW